MFHNVWKCAIAACHRRDEIERGPKIVARPLIDLVLGSGLLDHRGHHAQLARQMSTAETARHMSRHIDGGRQTALLADVPRGTTVI
jgi:hypothetical protein